MIALLMATALGAVSYLLVFRPLRKASTVSNLVASTGLLLVIQSLIVLQFGTSAVPVEPFLPQGNIDVLGASHIDTPNGVPDDLPEDAAQPLAAAPARAPVPPWGANEIGRAHV